MSEKQAALRVADVAAIDRFASHIGVWLTYSGAAFYDRYKDLLVDIGLKPPWVTALAFVEQYPDITQSDLGRKLSINRASAMALAASLEEAKLVEREKGGLKNQACLRLTKVGLERLTAACRVEAELSAYLFAGISKQQTAELLALLKQITQIASKP